MTKSFYRKHRSTLYIFPALLPLAELLPWLLTLIATLAGWSQHYFKNQKKTRQIFIVLAGFSLLAAIGAFAWDQYLNTTAARGSSTLLQAADISKRDVFEVDIPPPPAASGAVTGPSLLWSAATKNQNLGDPVISGGLLIIGSYQGTIEAYAAANGKRIWAIQKKEPVYTSASLGEGTAFIGEGIHSSLFSRFTAFALPDGAPLWERKFRSHIEASPALDEANHRLWMVSGENGLWALDSRNGNSLWHAPVGHIDASPLYLQGRLFTIARPDEKQDGADFLEIDPATGKTIHTVKVKGNPMCSLLPGPDDTILFATALGQVGVTLANDTGWAHAAKLGGALLWSVELPAAPLPEGTMLQDKSLLFYTLKNGALIALDARSGKTVWQEKVGESFNADAALIEEGSAHLIVAVTTDGTLSIRDALTGKETSRLSVPKNTYSAPLYHGGVLYIATPYEIRAYAMPRPQGG